MIKEVPDMERVRFDRERGVVDRVSASAEINPFDLYALQAAVDLRDRYGGRVTAISMGPPRCVESLRDAWARGADACICVTDRRFGGADTLATSRTLAAAIAQLDYDLILCGEKSVDGDTAQVGAQVAEHLDIPHSYYVEHVMDIVDGIISLTTADICGAKQSRKMKLPALVSVSRQISVPLLPTLQRKLESIDIDVQKFDLDDLSLSETDVGSKGSPTRVSKIVVPETIGRDSKIFRDDLSGFIEAMKPFVKGRRS